eukprot:3305127-Amphidinium_carterae.2
MYETERMAGYGQSTLPHLTTPDYQELSSMPHSRHHLTSAMHSASLMWFSDPDGTFQRVSALRLQLRIRLAMPVHRNAMPCRTAVDLPSKRGIMQ